MSAGPFADVRRFETVDSTNRYLLEQARDGAPEGIVAVADFQTAGRGRQGRSWEAPPGSNLLVSVLLRPSVEAPHRPLASGVVALAARAGVRRVTGLELGIKWPNDLVTDDGRKVAGVLAETDTDTEAGMIGGAGPPAVVVGLGLNCNWPTDNEAVSLAAKDPGLARAASLRQLGGAAVAREAVLSAFLDELAPLACLLGDGAGRGRLHDALRGACTTLGQEVRVELATRTVVGTATDVTGEGHLVVRTADRTEVVVAGDVVHLRAADPSGPPIRPPEAQG